MTCECGFAGLGCGRPELRDVEAQIIQKALLEQEAGPPPLALSELSEPRWQRQRLNGAGAPWPNSDLRRIC